MTVDINTYSLQQSIDIFQHRQLISWGKHLNGYPRLEHWKLVEVGVLSRSDSQSCRLTFIALERRGLLATMAFPNNQSLYFPGEGKYRAGQPCGLNFRFCVSWGSAGSDQTSRIISHDPLHYSSKLARRGRTPYRNRHIFHTVMSSSPTPLQKTTPRLEKYPPEKIHKKNR